MRYLIYGAGAIGGLIGGHLTAAGHDVTLVTRGAHREAMARRGLILRDRATGGAETIPVRAILPGEEKPPYDVVYVTLKAHQIAGSAEHIASLRAKDGCYVFVQNGLPWWYFERIASPYAGTRLKTLDPDGTLARMFPIETIVGSVIFKPLDLPEPGVIVHAHAPTDRLVIGEVDNTSTPRLEAIAADLGPAGLKTEISADIRKAKWTKLLSNSVWNPLCALTQARADQIASYPPSRALAIAMMKETLAVANAVGAGLDADPEKIVSDATKRRTPISSTLTDVRLGRQLELDALSRSIIEIGKLTGVPTPCLENIAACAGVLDNCIVEEGVAIQPVPVR
ncbi:MAG: 2-dehydropantoate 2-reductase [Betaproteobacteria bacterium]|nr:MAG: 2-dehydropantoate 2-reductase [Betaproteobacteria bacterium]